jgi:hypothetical protein
MGGICSMHARCKNLIQDLVVNLKEKHTFGRGIVGRIILKLNRK